LGEYLLTMRKSLAADEPHMAGGPAALNHEKGGLTPIGDWGDF
jgi:hypothetical protein